MREDSEAPITAGQYSLIRLLMGCYLVVHFLQLFPYGTELFSSEGILPASLSPLLGIILNPLTVYDSPVLVSALLLTGALCGLLIAIGELDRICSLAAVVILGWLYARNPLIANPSMPVVGWMLLAHAFLPTGAYGLWSSRGQPDRWVKWFYPLPIWIAAWIMLAVAYSYSGYTKFLSPSWVDGSAIHLVLENPLAREHFWRLFLLDLPPVFLQLLTWTVLAVELLFVFCCLLGVTRKWAWLIMLAIQLGFLVLLDFADLTFPMLLIHALTFDRNWVSNFQPSGNAIVFYDGTCAFCSGFVRFALSEDIDKKLEYSPLLGEKFRQEGLRLPDDDSIVVQRETGEPLYKGDAVIHCLVRLGGVWLLLGKLLSVFPRVARNVCYDFIGTIRYRLAGKVDVSACQILPREYAERILP